MTLLHICYSKLGQQSPTVVLAATHFTDLDRLWARVELTCISSTGMVSRHIHVRPHEHTRTETGNNWRFNQPSYSPDRHQELRVGRQEGLTHFEILIYLVNIESRTILTRLKKHQQSIKLCNAHATITIIQGRVRWNVCKVWVLLTVKNSSLVLL